MNCSAVGLHCVKIKTDFDFLKESYYPISTPFFSPAPYVLHFLSSKRNPLWLRIMLKTQQFLIQLSAGCSSCFI